MHITQLRADAVKITLCARIAVDFLCLLNERIEPDELVRSRSFGDMGAVDGEELASQFVEKVEGESLRVGAFSEGEENHSTGRRVMEREMRPRFHRHISRLATAAIASSGQRPHQLLRLSLVRVQLRAVSGCAIIDGLSHVPRPHTRPSRRPSTPLTAAHPIGALLASPSASRVSAPSAASTSPSLYCRGALERKPNCEVDERASGGN